MGFTDKLKDTVINSTTGGIGGIIGSLFNIGGSIAANRAANKQYKRTKELMALQHDYNKQAAEQSQKYAKEMWDYTNYPNQVKALEQAGLNAGLLYGMSGGGGASTAGADQEGVSGVGADQSAAMGLSLENMKAQTELAHAQANKANAEANKLAGVDTEEGYANIENLQAAVKNALQNISESESRQQLMKTQEKLNADLGLAANAAADRDNSQVFLNKEMMSNIYTQSQLLRQQFNRAEWQNAYDKEVYKTYQQMEIAKGFAQANKDIATKETLIPAQKEMLDHLSNFYDRTAQNGADANEISRMKNTIEKYRVDIDKELREKGLSNEKLNIIWSNINKSLDTLNDWANTGLKIIGGGKTKIKGFGGK